MPGTKMEFSSGPVNMVMSRVRMSHRHHSSFHPGAMLLRSLVFGLLLINASLGFIPPGFSSQRQPLVVLNEAKESQEEDAQEWKAVLAALKLYKAAYGDLKVPQRFIVPNLKPWPKPAWGIKLGKQVANMRSTGKYLTPERKQTLQDLGFVWQIRSSSGKEDIDQELIEQAMNSYKAIVGSDDIPPAFEVPDAEPWPAQVRGLPLGKASREKPDTKISSSQSPTSSQTARPAAPDQEEVSANEVRFRNVYTALQTYQQIYGDLLVPQPFAVPETPDWPQETWGLRLGARVNAIRSQGTFINNSPERKEMLDDIGFVWSPPKERRRGRKPKDEGESMDSMATDGDQSDNDELSDVESLMDFSFGMESGDSPSWGLESGREVPEEYMPPAEEVFEPVRTLADSLREATERAREVGIVEDITPNKRVIKGKREKRIPWSNDDFGEYFVFEDVVEALTIYKQKYGNFENLTMGEDFVVPTKKEVTGFLEDDDLDTFNLGASERAARAIASFEDEDDTDASEDLIAAEIRRLQREIGDVATEIETEVDFATSLSTGDDEWPEHLAGMALGSIVGRMRDGSLEVKHLPDRKAQLDALDFDWGDPKYFIDVPFEKAMCALYAYYLVRGDTFIDEDFVMPHEDPWPDVLAGYAIGEDVKRIRQLQHFFEAYHPEKVSLLRMLDFIWFPTMAMSLDPNEPEETSETILLNALGHPDYAKMIDIPMGLPDKIIADGPFFETDEPKSWWRKWHNWDYVKDYWYQQGRRDNAYALRKMGYPQMAEEHEAKYGLGLFTLMDQTMREIDDGAVAGLSLEQKSDVLQKLNFYRGEMLGCTDVHPEERDMIIADLDTKMLEIVKNTDLTIIPSEELEMTLNGVEQEEFDDSDDEYADEDDVDSFDEFDIEDELGLMEDDQ